MTKGMSEALMKLVLAALISVSFFGCGSSSNSAPASKTLFSAWTSPSYTLNLTNAQFGINQSIVFGFSGGARCGCQFDVSGTEPTGNYSLHNCSYTSGGSSDPGCALLNGPGTFTKSATVLNICDSGGCVVYQ